MTSNSNDKNRKVCHITSAHPRFDIRIFHKECVSLSNAGYEVFLLVNDSQPDETRDGVNVVSTGFSPKNRFERMILSHKKILEKALLIDAKVYHLHDPELLGVGTKLKKAGKKVIYDSHEDVPRQIMAKTWIHPVLRKTVSKVFEIYENKRVKKFDMIVVPTPHIYKRFNHINENVVELCNFPMLKEFRNIPEQIENKVGVCYVGAISKVRGIYEISKATKKLGIPLKICGKFVPDSIKEEILSENPQIEYLGFLDRKGVSNVIAQSVLGLVTLLPTPNHVNSYPIKMFEYMAAGIPVVASDFELWRNIVEKSDCGICVDPSNVEEIITAIDKLINDPKKAAKMGQNGRKAVWDIYNWEKEEIKLVGAYKNLI
ncbi:glycosyltransferase family 4 protein [Alkalibacter mobilis]|uniref:glycosyltransferase family 4 protein n=1 Tax=Alkalibacter mobilis TaxID=2787712 RepID=UPI0018A0CC33|nr:glycosyltransferase family 4 protein [Alkalibacter mobilis]MBF7096124.1 glycosyltransferase family 4 protein [Alkalibacter mobilis]